MEDDMSTNVVSLKAAVYYKVRGAFIMMNFL